MDVGAIDPFFGDGWACCAQTGRQLLLRISAHKPWLISLSPRNCAALSSKS
jgi:hypothetical protein